MEPQPRLCQSQQDDVHAVFSKSFSRQGPEETGFLFCSDWSVLPFGEVLSLLLGLISLKAPLTFLLDLFFGPLSEKVL